jgi:hypothetical protein
MVVRKKKQRKPTRFNISQKDKVAMLPRVEKYFHAILNSPVEVPRNTPHAFYPIGSDVPIPVGIKAKDSLTEAEMRKYLRKLGLAIEPDKEAQVYGEMEIPPFHEQFIRFVREKQRETAASQFSEKEIDNVLWEAWLILLQNIKGNVARQFISVDPSRKKRLDAKFPGWMDGKLSPEGMGQVTHELAKKITKWERQGIRRKLENISEVVLGNRIKDRLKKGDLIHYDKFRHLPVLQRLDLGRFSSPEKRNKPGCEGDNLKTEIINLGWREKSIS